jgi:hypothetical protein
MPTIADVAQIMAFQVAPNEPLFQQKLTARERG